MHESQQIAAELHNRAEQAHRGGARQHGKQEHLSGQESSRQDHEHTNKAYLQTQKEHQQSGPEHGAIAVVHEANEQDIAALAYELWQGRCCPQGSPEDDWLRAAEQLRSRP